MKGAAMQSQNRFFDDMAKVANSAAGVASGLREEVEMRVREQMERLLQRMDLVTREEFEVVREMAAQARQEQEALSARLAELEAQSKARPKRRKASEPET